MDFVSPEEWVFVVLEYVKVERRGLVFSSFADIVVYRNINLMYMIYRNRIYRKRKKLHWYGLMILKNIRNER